jgi:short-subunit dehydrogenase
VFNRIVADVGLPDLCILNAGTHVGDSSTAFDPQHFERMMKVNFFGTVACLTAMMPAYLAARRGHIAVVSSVAGYRGLPYAAAYGASKAALINMCESLQPELAAHSVRLSIVNPGFVRTPMTDQNRFSMPFLMEVDGAARSMRRGLASGRFEITFPKRFTWLVKGLRLLPIALYLRLTRRLLRSD